MWHPSGLDTGSRGGGRTGGRALAHAPQRTHHPGRRRARMGRARARARFAEPEPGLVGLEPAQRRPRRRACQARSRRRPRFPAPVSTSRRRPKRTPPTAHAQISFLGAPAGEIHVLSVVGEHSGSHAGHLRGYSQGDGASFQPSAPFEAGERVTVRAAIGAGARQARLLPLPRRHAVLDGQHDRLRQPPRGAGRLPELLHAARRASAGDDRDDARPRSRRRRRLHDQRARARPVRAADLHAAGSSGLVPAAARRRSRRGPDRAGTTKAGACSRGGGGTCSRSASARAKTS